MAQMPAIPLLSKVRLRPTADTAGAVETGDKRNENVVKPLQSTFGTKITRTHIFPIERIEEGELQISCQESRSYIVTERRMYEWICTGFCK